LFAQKPSTVIGKAKEVLTISGQRDQVDKVVKELEKLYIDDANHELKLTLSRHPTTKETQMIRTYVGVKFNTKVSI